jgi:small GTP-binding protein
MAAAGTEKVKCVVLGAADAGKTSLLRRYFRDTFAPTRVPTVGSDFYTKRVALGEGRSVLLQMFDTPGEVPVRRVRDEDQEEHMVALMDAFVGRVDGVLLVYDMTNSTSFTQLRLWHAQWRKRSDTPLLIVGNKRDLVPTTPGVGVDGHTHANPLPTVPQRDVLGFRGSFKGKDFRYEYRVDHQVGSSNNCSNTCSSASMENTKQRHQISTFTSTATNLWTSTWTSDGTYLDSLLGTEDRSNPDRDMVKLWCMRNGLEHVEVSALLDQGGQVQTAMETLVRLVLQARNHQQQQLILNLPESPHHLQLYSHSQSNGNAHYNPELDLLDRYRPKHGKCCFGFCPTIHRPKHPHPPPNILSS